MSRRDDRKALELRLPEMLRKDLKSASDAYVPLAYLVRQLLIKAFREGHDWQDDVEPGATRPILLQLSPDERAHLTALAFAHDVSEEVAVLSLVRTLV